MNMKDRALKKSEALLFLTRMGESVNRFRDIEDMMTEVSELLVESLRVDAICLYLGESSSYRLAWTHGLSPAFAQNPFTSALDKASTAAFRAVNQRRVVFASGPRGNPRAVSTGLLAEGKHALSWVPLLSREGTVGVLALARNAEAPEFNRGHIEVMQAVGNLVGMAIANTALYSKVSSSEARYRSLYDNAPVMCLTTDKKGRITECNKALLEGLGYDSDELIGKKASTLNAEGDKDWEIQDRADGPTEIERVIRGRDGEIHEVLVFHRPLLDVDGARDGSIVMFQDVTERNRLESENRYKSLLVDNSADVMFVRDTDTREILHANEAAWKSYGYSREEFLQLEPRQLASPEFQAGDRLDKLHEQFLRDGGYSFSGTQQRKDGSLMDTEITSRLMVDRGRRIATIIIRDVTERNSMQRQLQRAQNLESLGRLAVGIAHDFNNMLVGILGHASLLKSYLAENDPIRESVNVVEMTATRAAQLVSQLVVFAKGGKPRLTPVDLNSVTEDVTSIVLGSLGKNISLVKRLDPGLPAVAADESQLTQCVLNLCVNARDAMPHGGTLTVETATTFIDDRHHSIGSVFLAPGAYVIIKVTDTGIGMDAETQKRIFEPFFTTKEAKGGSGFGLATIYGIVTNRGGHIDVASHPGKGSSFTIILPAMPPAVGEADEQGTPAPKARKGTILVAEDDDTIRDFLKIVLTKAGYAVLLAEDGRQALKLFQDNKSQVDLVILDLIMPGMDGKDTFTGLRKIAPDVRVLVSSGYADESRSIKGAMGYLQKPYHLKGLLDAVDGAIGAAS